VVGFAHDILKRICEECVPTGALVFGASAYPMAKRVIDDASIAHRALAMTWPDMDPSAANQTQARDMERSAARVLHDALAVLRETKDVLRVLQFKGDMSEVARCGRAMNEAGIVIRKLEEQFGGEIEWAAEEARDLLR
jgi:hypothetical protein